MTNLLEIFASAVEPIVAIVRVGYPLAVTKDVNLGSLNTVVIPVLAPALVFHSLAVTELAAATLTRITVDVVAFTVAMCGITEAFGRAVGKTEPMLSGLVLVASFSNVANLGLPVSHFAFGNVGRQTAVIFLSV